MSKSRNQDDFDIQDFVSEDEQEMQTESGVNAYFLLDLRLPDPKLDGVRNQDQSQSSSAVLEKFGFIDLLEKIHGRDLRTNNPLLNPTALRVRWKDRFKKKVSFSTTEIKSNRAQLPHCRRRVHGKIKPGQLHAPSCRNSAQETVEVLGEHAWQNRVFILDAYLRNVQHSYSRSREASESDGEESEGYCKARAGSLEEIGVFDSVELAKQRLQSLTGREVVLDSSQDKDDETPGSSSQFFEESQLFDRLQLEIPTMNLDLGSPFSDEDCPTSASTIHLSDQASTDTPDNVFFAPPTVSYSVIQTLGTQPAASSQHSFSNESKSTENQFKFEMCETPKFRKLNSHSDYGSENYADEGVDLSNIVDELPSQSTTAQSPHKSPLKTSPGLSQSSQDNRPTFKPADSARLRGTVKIADRSVIGGMFSGSSGPETVPRTDSNVPHLTQFMFDTPSPHD